MIGFDGMRTTHRTQELGSFQRGKEELLCLRETRNTLLTLLFAPSFWQCGEKSNLTHGAKKNLNPKRRAKRALALQQKVEGKSQRN